MEKGTYFRTREQEQVKYYANLTNSAHSAFMYNVEVLTHGDNRYLDYLKAHPNDLKLTIAHILPEYPFSACGIIVCRDEDELNSLLKVSHDWLVTELWQEKQQIHITEQMIAVNSDK